MTGAVGRGQESPERESPEPESSERELNPERDDLARPGPEQESPEHEKLTGVTAATVGTDSDTETEQETDEPTLHQPKRALIAVGEVVLVALLVPAAVWCWNRGVVHYSFPVPDQPPLESTRFKGNWIGASVGLVTVAGVLLLDAIRQTVLAVRTRGREQVEEPDV